jgi:hypothetical protein
MLGHSTLRIASRRWVCCKGKSVPDRQCDQIPTVWFNIQGVTLDTQQKPTGEIESPTDLAPGFGSGFRMLADTR